MVRYNLKLNIQKTKILPYFNTKLTNDITIGNIKIDIVDNYTFLGMYLDTKLSFNIHIDNLYMKLSKIIYLIKRLSYLNIKNLILLYNSLFLSNLIYGIEIWGNIYNSNLNILNLSQKKIIRIINKKIIDNSKLPLIRLSHTSILFYNSNILKLDDLITFRNILIIYNLLNNKYVNDITDYFKFNRNKTKFILPLMKTNRFQNTIFFKGPKFYNLIMFNNILKTNTITHTLKLKKVLKSFFIKQYYKHVYTTVLKQNLKKLSNLLYIILSSFFFFFILHYHDINLLHLYAYYIIINYFFNSFNFSFYLNSIKIYVIDSTNYLIFSFFTI